VIYRLRLFGREIASLEVLPHEFEPRTEEPRPTSRVGGGSSHNFEMAYEDPDTRLGFQVPQQNSDGTTCQRMARDRARGDG